MEKSIIDKVRKTCIKELEKLPLRVGNSIYVRIQQRGQYQMLDINSKELYNFMLRKMYQDYHLAINKTIWDFAVSFHTGKYTIDQFVSQKVRIGGSGDNTIYYDLLDIHSKTSHFIEITKNGWRVIAGDLDNYAWNSFQLPQEIPQKENADIWKLPKYLNLDKDDTLMLMVFLITCFIPDIQHPILNISGEAGTGKSTISRLIKDLVDPSKAPMNDFSDGEDGIRLPLSQNHLTVFDNIEKMPPKLNALFCRAVTGGETIQRKFYTNNKTVAIPLNSIVIMNGISSFIRKEDLMSRTVFLQTQPLKTISMSGKLLNSYHSDKAEILAGIFDTLSNAMNIIEHVTLSESYRMMEFATWGYAIAEALGKGNGKTFMRLLKRNEALQLQETHANEPLITLISNYMTMRKGEEVDKLTSSFYEEIMRHADTYLGSGSEHMKRMLPQTHHTFSKKINTLKSIFKKLGIDIEIGRTGDVRNLSRISISMISEPEVRDKQNDVEEALKDEIKRTPIVGIRVPITGLRKAITLSEI